MHRILTLNEECWRDLHTAVHYIAATTVQVMNMEVIFSPFGFRS